MEKILEKLDYIEPGIKKFPVLPEDAKMGVFLLNLEDVCYISTKTDSDRKEVVFVTKKKKYYSNLNLKEIAEKLDSNKRFLRTSRYFIINLEKVSGIKVNNARDLWFEGIKKPVENAVFDSYLREFEERLNV